MNHNDKQIHFTFSDLREDRSGNCPHEQELILFFQNLLPERQRKRFELHLKDCFECSSGLIDLREAESRIGSSDLPEPEIEAAVESVHNRFEQFLNNRVDTSSSKKELYHAVSYRSSTRFAFALAFLMLAVVGYFFYQNSEIREKLSTSERMLAQKTRENNRLEEEIQRKSIEYDNEIELLAKVQKAPTSPVLSHTIIRSVNPERSNRSEPIQIAFEGKLGIANVLFSFPGLTYSSYRVEIHKKQNVVWSQEIEPQMDPQFKSSFITLVLYRQSFESGEYELKILGIKDKESVFLVSYPLLLKS